MTHNAGSGVITAVFPATSSIAVGDYACGGRVAYILQFGDSGYVVGEQRGLVVGSNEMTGSSIHWAESSFQSSAVVNGTSTNFGTGMINSSNIIAENGAGTTYAAGLARTCSDGGYADWFLPSWSELHTAYTNLGSGVLPGALLWSSSEASASTVHTLNTGNGNDHQESKGSIWQVLAVRYF